jgi:hypothetical protein
MVHATVARSVDQLADVAKVLEVHMARRGNGVHTVPNPAGNGWVNEVAGNITSHHHTQRTAIETGRREAVNRETEHFIHNREGQIRERNSYGNDPYPAKG